MKINNLKLCAFGPFCEEVYLDFEPINSRGIFLLTGPTGVGKTTIFDAICFALYGEISSSYTSIDKFAKVRSDYASSSTLTYVELSFSLGDKTYFVRREPSQIRLSNRTNKEVLHTHQSFLKSEGLLIEKANEVTSKIENLIGLNAAQFKQVVMLPQGDFVKLLTASSDAKMDIFRKIFSTYEALGLENLLTSKTSDAKKNLESETLNLEALGKTFRYLNADNLTMYTKLIGLSQYEELMQRELDDEKNTLAILSSKKLELKELLASKTSDLSLVLKNNEALETKEELLKKLAELKIEEKSIEEDKDVIFKANWGSYLKELNFQINDNVKKRQNISISNQLIKDKLSLLEVGYSQLAVSLEELDKKENNHKANVALLQECCHKLLEIEKAINLKKQMKIKEDSIIELKMEKKNLEEVVFSNEKIINLKDKTFALITQTKEQINLLNNKISKKEQEIMIFKSILSYRQKLQTCQQEHQDNQRELLILEEKQKKINELILNNKAYDLSLSLKDNEACPVCGSLNHPHKAQIKEFDLSSRDEIDADYAKCINLDQNCRLQIESLLSTIKELENQLANIDNLGNFNLRMLEEKKKALDKMLFEEGESLKLAEQSLSKINETIINNKDILLQIQNKNQQIIQMELNLENLKGSITNTNIDEKDLYLEKSAELSKQINYFENKHKETLKNIADIKDEMTSLRATLLSNESSDKQLEISQCDLMFKFNSKKEELKISNYEDCILSEEKQILLNEKIKNYDLILKVTQEKLLKIMDLTKNVSYKSTDELCVLIKELENENTKCIDDYAMQLAIFKNNQEISLSFNSLYQGLATRIKEFEKLNNLTVMLNGKVGTKISLERYLIFAYFDQILYEANIKLALMSNNRYQMIRRNDARGNASAGLEIDIYDCYTGHARDVRTLSGGESFKSALSLALGLSEVIRGLCSGISLETVFIDEGFGSLDPQSLDLALNTLNDMRLEGHVIGIISHVEELKERIDTKIVIEATQKGSFIKSVIY